MVFKEVAATHLQAGQGRAGIHCHLGWPRPLEQPEREASSLPLLSQVVSQLPVGPESRETLFLAEQPPLPPSLTNGTTVPTAKPTPTLIKVQFSGLYPVPLLALLRLHPRVGTAAGGQGSAKR